MKCSTSQVIADCVRRPHLQRARSYDRDMTSFGQEILPFRTPPNRGDLLASVATQRFFDPVHSKQHSAIPVVRGVSSGAINEVGSRALCIETPRTNVHPAACYLSRYTYSSILHC